MERLVRSCYKQGGYQFAKKPTDIAREYGIDRIARLASNENPHPPSSAVMAAAKEALLQVNRYPDERVDLLTTALRQYYGDYRFVTGVGMDGVIETLIRTLVEPGETVAISTPTFSFYGLAAQGKAAKIVVLCTPNNPTGNATPVADVTAVLDSIDGVLFLDNAYVEFSDYDYLPLLKKYDNLIIGRTFSKVHALAGLRIGYAFDTEHASQYIGHVKRWRRQFSSKLKFPVLPSDANFVMVDVSPYASDEMVEKLARHGVIVRSCRSFLGLSDHYIRVSIGEDWENELFIQEINAA